jgi:hypothetical protein
MQSWKKWDPESSGTFALDPGNEVSIFHTHVIGEYILKNHYIIDVYSVKLSCSYTTELTSLLVKFT